MRRFEDVSGPLRAAVAAVHAALDPLDPLPPECAGTSHTAPELTELVGSPGFMAYESAVCDLLGEVRYALLTLARATQPPHRARTAARGVNNRVSRAHQQVFEAWLEVQDIVANAAR
uniref:Uncharacterized protein n=2 Tax=Mycolicibacterium fortuitum TaxID=1766 RepID=Q52147_MYCFO|nr:unknown protein [Mycolicibacterium fortuitum]